MSLVPLRPINSLFQCECQPHETQSFSPLSDLLPERTAPELLYLESQFASLMSYGLSVKLLAEVLPIDERLNATTIRNHAQRLGDRLDAELGEEQFMFAEGCQRDWEALPRHATNRPKGSEAASKCHTIAETL